MISVIIPTLNEEKLLPQLLDQFSPDTIQKYNIEIIVSDGGSKDRTCEIVKDKGFSLIRHDNLVRQTIAEGRNAGAKSARGEILVFINADVRIGDVEKFFQNIVAVMHKSRILAATCAVHVFPEEETLVDRLFHILHNLYIRFLNFLGEGMGRGECQIIRKEIFDRLGGYNRTLAAGEDYNLFRRVRRMGNIAFMKGIVIYESPRRFRKYGYLWIIWGWTKNAIAVVVRNRSSSETWEAVR